jgi:hypothetical protein
MQEKAKRLAPSGETLRELFLKSGNICAFPNCGHLMMDADGVFIGQVCHIEAAEEGGERFNPNMSNEDRRGFANLMLMCLEHHKVTDDVAKFPAEKLRQMKTEHERRFSRPDRAILEKLTDWTTIEQPKRVANLRRLDEVLGWGSTDEDRLESINALNAYIERFGRVPIEVRRFLGAAVARAHRMRDTPAVRYGSSHLHMLVSDLQAALRLEPRVIDEFVKLLEAYGLGDFDEMETDSGAQLALRIRGLKSGWAHWPDLLAFCHKTNVGLEVFTEDLDFARLDDGGPPVLDSTAEEAPGKAK